MTSQQTQLDGLLARMKSDGYSFKSQKNWDGSRDVHSLLTKKGKDLYATLVPTSVVWADLTGEGTNGSKLPNGGEIDSKGAKYTLTVQCGGDELSSLVEDGTADPEAAAALAAAQAEQFAYFQTMIAEYWAWVWDHADADEAIKAVKADGVKQVRSVIAMARKVGVADVPLDDPDVQSMALQNFIESASSPFGVSSKTGAPVFKATQKVFLKAGGRRLPPRVVDLDGVQRNADGEDDAPYVMRGMLVTARVRFGAWAFAGRHGVRADLIRTTVLNEGAAADHGVKHAREDETCSAFASKRPRA